MSGRQRSRRIGQVLALTRHGRLHDGCDERRDDHGDDSDDQDQRVSATPASLISPATTSAKESEPQKDVGDETNRDDEPEHDGRDANVVVLHMAEFMSHHTLELGVVHDVE